MENIIESVTINSSWRVKTHAENHEKAANETFCYKIPAGCVKVHHEGFQFDPESMIDYDSCCQVVRPGEEEEEEGSSQASKGCTLTFNLCEEGNQVSKLVFVSECRRVEVFGSNDEYIETREGTIVDDSDDEIVLYKIEIDFTKHRLKKFKTKLTSLGDRCWILGLHLELNQTESTENFIKPRFDLKQVNQLLGTNDDSNLSAKAKEFKKLFENFQSSPNFLLQTNSMQLLNGSLNPFNTDSSKVLPFSTSRDDQSKHVTSGSQVCKCDCSQSLIEMEKRLTDKIDEENKIVSEKMNMIVSLLEDVKRSLKS